MKQKIIFVIFAFLILHFTFFIQLSAADTWTKTYRPFQEPYMADKYFVEDVIVTQDSGYVVSGSFELCDEFYWERWGFLMKTDKDGNMLWARKDSVDFMSENGYEVDFTETDNGCLLSIGYAGFGGDRYMIKRDSEGNRLWAIPYNTGFGVFSMHNTQDGNIILAGRSDYNASLRKITEDGTTLWTKIVDVGSSIAYSIYECNNGNYLLTGINFDNYDILVIRTDSNGDSLWTRTFDGLGGHDIGRCIIETGEGNVLIGGRIDEPKKYNNYGGFLGLLDTEGDSLWTEVFDENILYTIGSMIEVSDGFILQGGKLVKIDHTPNVIWNEPLTGDVFGGGDKNLQETHDGGFICVATESYGNHIVLNKTDSLGQVVSIDDPSNPSNNISISIFPNPVTDNCTITLNSKISLKDPSIMIYNIKGQIIRELKIQNSKFKINEVIWDGKTFNGKEVQNGIYFLKLEVDNYTTVKKVTKIK